MTFHRDPLTDPLNDWLDAGARGEVPPLSPDTDADLNDLIATARQLDHLARQNEQVARTQRLRSTWEDTMAANPALQPALPEISPRLRPSSPTWRGGTSVRQRFDHYVTGALVAVLVAVIGGGAWLAADGNPFGGGNEPPATIGFGGFGPDGGDANRFAPVATVGADQESSSIPFPTSHECTVEPLTRDEVVAQLTLANMATEEERARYEQPIVPSSDDATAIMQTFRMWQACHLNDRAFAYGMQLETPWFTADQSPLFLMNGRPVSDELIEEFADIAIVDGGREILWPPVYGTPPADGSGGMESATPDLVPIPDGATPVAFPSNSTGNAPTIFAEDIMITGPDTANATVYFVNPETLEVSVYSPNVSYEFVKVDGQWLLNAYHESQSGG